jgi:hypothetical protein
MNTYQICIAIYPCIHTLYFLMHLFLKKKKKENHLIFPFSLFLARNLLSYFDYRRSDDCHSNCAQSRAASLHKNARISSSPLLLQVIVRIEMSKQIVFSVLSLSTTFL